MGSDGVFSAEMPDEPSQAIVPLDADTAERLLSGRLDPDDAPPGYAEVARLLQAAAAPADPAELAGQAAAMDAFRTTHARPTQRPGRPAPRPGRRVGGPAGAAPGPPGGRGAGWSRWRWPGSWPPAGWWRPWVGLWTAGGAPSARELGSPSGGPSAGGSGSGTPGSGQVGRAGTGRWRRGRGRLGRCGRWGRGWRRPRGRPRSGTGARGGSCRRPANGRPRGTAAV